jgi:4-amino-4-deoxy-L-arabinose transferase-like glycosyltransferase
MLKRNLSKYITLILILIAIFIGLFLRLKFAYGTQQPLSSDAKNYDITVRQFLTKGFLGYKSSTASAYVVPGYPLFLSLIYSIFGYIPASPFTAVRLIQAFLSTASIYLIFLIGGKIGNNRIGIAAAFFAALYLPFIQSVSYILTETLYTFFFLSYLLIQIKAITSLTPALNIASGIAFAAAVLIRPTIFPLFALPYIYKYITIKDKKVFKAFGFFSIGMTLALLPWWIRNCIVLGKFVLLSTGSGNPVFSGAFPYFNYSNLSQVYVLPPKQLAVGLNLIINGFLTQPVLYLKWFTVGKLSFIFGKPWYIGQTLSSFLYLHHVIVVLGFTGALFAFVSKRFRLISLFVILLSLLQLMFIPDPRYAYPIMPLLMILAAYVLDYLFFQKAKNREDCI